MHRHYIWITLTAILAFATLAVAQNSTPAQPVELTFTVAMPRPHTHMLEVDIGVQHGPGTTAPTEEVLVLPVWTPGSYLIREFERHVQDFAAQDAAGKPLKWEKTNKNTWKVFTNGASNWHANYRVYANELTARTNELNSSHAFWNNAALLMYLDGYLKSPSTVRVLAPDVWKVATGLPAVLGQKNTFRAENFDVLYDSPIEVSDFKTLVFNVKGVPHRIVIDGEGNYDPERMRLDVQKIVETEVAIMGEIPYRDYTFLLHLRTNGGDGIEHLNSTSLTYPRFGFKTSRAAGVTAINADDDYHDFLSLVAHEFFHLWNVKRIRPDALGPFDYTKENYTKMLWVAEGITDYYAELVLRRAGFISDTDYLAATARSLQSLQNTPGRLVQTVEEASFESWVKFYRQNENSLNSQISYYDKGAILGLLLDLEIRKASNGAKSLDDAMRYLYNEFYKKDRNYGPEDFQKACETAAGTSLETFFSKYVRSKDELDFNASLAAAGLKLETTTTGGGGKPVERVFLGADTQDVDGNLIVRRVYAGSPAYEQGLNSGDQIVAINNMRASKQFFDSRIAEKKPGDLVNLTIFRSDDLSTLLIKLGGKSDISYRIVPLATATPAQKEIYRAWLGVGTN